MLSGYGNRGQEGATGAERGPCCDQGLEQTDCFPTKTSLNGHTSVCESEARMRVACEALGGPKDRTVIVTEAGPQTTS